MKTIINLVVSNHTTSKTLFSVHFKKNHPQALVDIKQAAFATNHICCNNVVTCYTWESVLTLEKILRGHNKIHHVELAVADSLLVNGYPKTIKSYAVAYELHRTIPRILQLSRTELERYVCVLSYYNNSFIIPQTRKINNALTRLLTHEEYVAAVMSGAPQWNFVRMFKPIDHKQLETDDVVVRIHNNFKKTNYLLTVDAI